MAIDMSAMPDVRLIDYDRLPKHIQEGMRNYIENRCRPGGFLHAVLSNDLTGAVARGDASSVAGLRDIVMFLLNEPVDGICWGSPGAVTRWLAGGLGS